jgi:hypothetical protein
MFVYVIVCRESLKLYVGQHKGSNLRKYLQTKLSDAKNRSEVHSHLFCAMRKYPRESWGIWPLISDLQTRDEVDYWERFYIKVLKAQHPDVGYNICRGGEGGSGYPKGHAVSKETRQKIARGHQGKPLAMSTRLKMRQRPRKMTYCSENEVLDAYYRGASTYAIGKRFGVTGGSVRSFLKSRGVYRRVRKS